jgi:nitrous oxide reductase accessory protein NosL
LTISPEILSHYHPFFFVYSSIYDLYKYWCRPEKRKEIDKI